MNYIKHLSAFFEKIHHDNRLNPNHVSLYVVLFQLWNSNRFENPFPVNRAEVMHFSKIGSLNTYHKCLRDLHNFNYIKYIPSHNPLKASQIHLYNFDTTANTTLGAKSIQQSVQPRRKNDTTNDTTLAPLYKHSKHINNKTISGEHTQNEIQNVTPPKMKTEMIELSKPLEKRKKVAPKKENGKIPPILDEVLTFFKSETYPELEAWKFFNHFESNGWKVGGKTPMQNWHAAARNWMLNASRFAPSPQQQSQVKPNGKNYDEPL